MTKDSIVNHLIWIHDRMVRIHGENADYDYMIKLEKIIGEVRRRLVDDNTISELEHKVNLMWGLLNSNEIKIPFKPEKEGGKE
jgi:hypothetical protein